MIERVALDLGLSPRVLGRAFRSLSGGERTRALIASLFATPRQYALIDEPTNHLDAGARQQVAEFLAAHSTGFLVVSHDRAFLDRCCDHVVSIEQESVSVFKGGYSAYKQQREQAIAFEQRARDSLEREIRHLKRASRQRRDGAAKREKDKHGAADKGFVGARAARQMKRAIAIERRIQSDIEHKQTLIKRQDKVRRLRLATTSLGERTLIVANNLCVDRQRQRVINDVSFRLSAGERLAIVGPNGCGKSTLLDAVAGIVAISQGTLQMRQSVRFHRAYQTPLWMQGNLHAHLDEAGHDQQRFRIMLGEFGVSGDIFDRPLESFSFGERKKVDLCRTLCEPADFLIWHEPLNYIDVLSREQIQSAISLSQPTLIFVEHDRYFVESIATDVLALHGEPSVFNDC